MQDVEGVFKMRLWGIPGLLFVTRTQLVASPSMKLVRTWTLHVTPFLALGLVNPAARKLEMG